MLLKYIFWIVQKKWIGLQVNILFDKYFLQLIKNMPILLYSSKIKSKFDL